MPVPSSYKPSDTKPESKNFRAEDFDLDESMKLLIGDVNIELMPARDDKPARKRLILSFVGNPKGLVLNATNQGFLTLRFGQDPNAWVGLEVIVMVTTVQFGNDTVKAFRIIQARRPEGREPGED